MFTVSLNADTLFQPPLHVLVTYACDYSSLPLTKKGMGEPTTLNIRLFKGSLMVYSVFTVSLDEDILISAPIACPGHLWLWLQQSATDKERDGWAYHSQY